MIEKRQVQNFSSSENQPLIIFLSKVLDRRLNDLDWDWEFNSLGDTIFNFMVSDEKIVATQSMLPIPFFYKNHKISTYKSESTFILKEYRGKNIFENLYEKTVDDAFSKNGELIWGFTPAINAWKRNFKFTVEEDVMISVSFQFNFNRCSSLKKIIKNLIFSPAILINRLKIKTTDSIQLKNSLSKEQLSSFNQDFLNKNSYAGIDLTTDFVGWRTEKNPFLRYTIVSFISNDNVIGAAIYSIQEDTLKISYFAMLVETDYEKGLNILLRNALKNKELSKFSYWGNSNNSTNKIIFDLFQSKKLSTSQIDPSRSLVYKFCRNKFIKSKDMFINGLWTEGIRS